MGSKQKTPSGKFKRILPTFCILISAPFIGCGDQATSQIENDSDGSSQYELKVTDTEETNSVSAGDIAAPESQLINEEVEMESKPEPRTWMEFPWRYTVRPLVFDGDGTPIPVEMHPRSYYRITTKTKRHTMEIHRQVAKAVGLHVTEEHTPRFALFLTTRSSIETTLQGNQRPFDTRGTIHGLDVKAAYRSGIRGNRDKYIEAGNQIAIDEPHLFLGYGQGGMISWLFLDNWDLLGDPRMLGDSVIGGLTYRRSLVEKFRMLKNSRIKCYEYDDVGREIVQKFNGKKYAVARWRIDQEKYDQCVADGPKSKPEKKDDTKIARRCRSSSRMSYSWRPGLEQPENTVPVKNITWWELKRATGGKPCPPWKGDEKEAALTGAFLSRADEFDFDPMVTVRRTHLGNEPEGVNQYDLWMTIWDATMDSLGEEPIKWENLRMMGAEESISLEPSKEKLEDLRKLSRGESLNPAKR